MFKKSVILLVVAILAVLAYGTLSTGAWFTDQVASGSANVSTGNFELSISQEGDFTITHLEPGAGYQELGTVCIKNTGNYDMKFRGWVTEIGDAEILKDHLQVRTVINPVALAGDQYGPTGVELFKDVPITSLMGPNGYIITGPGAEPFYDGYEVCYLLEVKLTSAAGNLYQNKTLTGKLYIEGTQFINTGWGE